MTNDERAALVRRVRRTLAERDAAYSHPDYDREPLDTSHLDWRDLRALCDELERLAADAKRMDYMDAQRNWTRWMGRDSANGSYTVWPVFGDKSFRAAIDAAMAGGTDDE